MRVHYEGALNHVIVRKNNKSSIFMESKWKNAYLEIVKRLSDIRKAIVLLSEKYCKLSNKEIANTLKLDPSMVSKIKNDTVVVNEEVISIMERYENK